VISARYADAARPQLGDDGTTRGAEYSTSGALANRSGCAPLGKRHDEVVVWQDQQVVRHPRPQLLSLPTSLVFAKRHCRSSSKLDVRASHAYKYKRPARRIEMRFERTLLLPANNGAGSGAFLSALMVR
jgi:hypothetical protein